MKRHGIVVLALLVCTAIFASEQSASAQRVTRSAYQNSGPNAPAIPRTAPPIEPYVEELPPGSLGPGEGPFRDDAFGNEFHEEFDPGFHGQNYHHGGCDESLYGCADGCGGDVDSYSGGVWPGRFYFTADYLYARANFSEAVSFVQREILADPDTATDTFHQLDFEYESSYRLGAGYQLPRCGEEIRFLYTRLRSSAEDSTSDVTDIVLVPFLENPLITGEEARIRASVDVDAFDLEYRKTIPLGGTLSSGCADPCDCPCPAWDITWSGGVRGADVNWERSYLVLDGTTTTRETTSELEFSGAGPRVGMEGRRYFGHGGWFSIFMKGDISLLLGHLDLDIVQREELGDENDETDDAFGVQSQRVRQIVPVTEIETGVTANVTCHSTFSAGYLFSAWHDLGFRDEFRFVSTLETQYDDANILSFDGFFARWEWAY